MNNLCRKFIGKT